MIHSIVVMASKSRLKAVDLPPEFDFTFECSDPSVASMYYSSEDLKQPLKTIFQDIERNIIKDAVATYGSIAKAAEVLQVNQSTIFRKIREQTSQNSYVAALHH